VPDTGAEIRRFVKGRVNYTSEPLDTVRVVEDFLSPPEDLVFKEENVKVPMSLRKSSVEFFKTEAESVIPPIGP
jgi:hypothetical protein